MAGKTIGDLKVLALWLPMSRPLAINKEIGKVDELFKAKCFLTLHT